eukprot:TRINITY_DN45703_c0_g1_i1.p1 TRINITY_DN45703_c0_g1~~TRINITY_DN45703_c0_g1_i1.p1  ORF type:complete len:720 (+),score=154.65 TRINITY_DN45703_c0_g1_i1:119-2161(+)
METQSDESSEEYSAGSDQELQGSRSRRPSRGNVATARGCVLVGVVIAAVALVVVAIHQVRPGASGEAAAGEAASLVASLAPSLIKRAETRCSAPGDECGRAIEWAKTVGIKYHRDWYPGLTPDSSLDDFQFLLAEKRLNGCSVPCSKLPKDEDTDVTMVTDMPCTDQESCLKIVDAFLDGQPRTTFLKDGAALVQTFGANSQGGGSCGSFCELPKQCPDFDVTQSCRFDTYDNALTAIYYTMRGKLPEAKRILDAFVQLLYATRHMPNAFGARNNLPSKRRMNLLAASYTSRGASAGEYWGTGVADGGVDTGNNAWVAMAFARYAAVAKQPCYALPAYDILQAIRSEASCDDDLQGFMARFAPYQRFYRSTEHNIDMFALSRMLNATGAQEKASTFVKKMFGFTQIKENQQMFATGTDGKARCDTDRVPAAAGATPVDAQLWNVLADAADDASSEVHTAMQESLRPSGEGGFVDVDKDLIGNFRGEGRGEDLTGFRFSSFGSGVQWENTASGIMGMIHYRAMTGDNSQALSKRIVEMRRSVLGMLGRYGSVLASVQGGNMQAYSSQDKTQDFPGGSDTGLGWTYLRYPHTAATAWTGMMLLYQAQEGMAVDEGGNPYARPRQPVPDEASAVSAAEQCLPAGAIIEDGSKAADASCAAHPGCAGLLGDCCPTAAGLNLGCC